MYQCGFCKQVSNPGEGCRLVVVERRTKEYPAVALPRVFGEFKSRWSHPGKGFETVREVRMCPRCAENPVNQRDIAISEGTCGKLQDTAKVTAQKGELVEATS